jgi:hypothetical protein
MFPADQRRKDERRESEMMAAFNGAPPPGHNSRRRDVVRTAEEIAKRAEEAARDEEIRQDHLKRWTTNSRLPYVVQALNAASLAEDVTGDQFKKLYLLSRKGGKGADDITADNEVMAALARTDLRGWRRFTGEMEEKGWLTKSPTYKDGRQSVNKYKIVPQNVVLRVLENIDLEATPWGGQTNPPIDELGRVEPTPLFRKGSGKEEERERARSPARRGCRELRHDLMGRGHDLLCRAR